MKIGINVSSINNESTNQHKVRGSGFYVENLILNLKKYDKNNEYILISNEKEIDKVDIIHYPIFDLFFLTLPKSSNIPFVVTVHDLTPILFPKHFPVGIKGKIKWLIEKNRLNKATEIITVSNSAKQDIHKVLKIPQNKIHSIYLGANSVFTKKQLTEREINNIIKKYNLPSKFVLYVGDATWNKNLPNIIKACNLVQVPLVLVGKAIKSKDVSNNPWTKDLQIAQKLITENKNLIALGFVPTEDLVTIYNLASCLVMPSFYEGFGLPLVEAMKCGCPIITSNRGSIPEVVGESALFVNPENINEIGDTINKVFLSTELKSSLSNKGLEQSKKFSWEKTAKETIQVYESIQK